MKLEMRAGCGPCGRDLGWDDLAFICSYECTFYGNCVADMGCVCPNCGGELVRRPRREEV